MKRIIDRLVDIGISSEMTTVQKGLLKLSNKMAWSAFIFCFFLGIVALFISENVTAIYDFSIAFAIFIPILLNYFNKHKAAKLMLIFSTITIVSAGSLIYGYDSVFKYLIILPISVTFIFYSDEKKWKLYSLLAITILSIVFFEIDKFYNLNFPAKDFNNNFSQEYHTGHIFESLTFMLLIALYVLVQSYFRSILRRKESELMIYKKIFDNSNEGLSIIDTKGRYIKQNKAHEEILGFTDKELEKETPAIHMGKDLFLEIADTIKKKGEYEGGFISNTKFGEKHINIMTFSIIEDNKIQCIVGIIRDITEKEKVLKALQDSEENLKTANAAKDKFFSIIGHDLRSPFNSLIGFSEIMLKNDTPIEKIKMYAQHINETSVSTYRLLDNLLDWARLQTNNLKPNIQNTNLTEIIKNSYQSVKNKAIEKNIEIISQLETDVYVDIDKNMIETVLRNLISNAIKYCNNGDAISITLKKADSTALISIKDTGIGICKEVLAKLFKTEQPISTRGTNNETGTGLGLILCKEFVARNNGKINVESTLGEGTVFSVLFPLNNKTN